MKRTAKETFTPSRFASLVGADRHEIQRKLNEIGATPVEADGRGEEFTIRDLVKAHMGGDIKREQLRRTKEEADRLAIQNARSRGELIEISEVIAMTRGFFSVLRSKVMSFSITEDERDQLLAGLQSFRDVDWSAEAHRCGARGSR
jgi:hypothetical protein